ncbi:FAD-dependent oxidoreductase [Amphritea balenae]|uniref:Ferredoxin-NADP reductase n=1 Tax=Amphritea balenae TaxID=452629 RepID=A0A3P1SUP2_9GAMM|nr:FAD-dependent oxidoreductase [Amphritea balenae]RRD00685.1 ferredoxin-NADP reductase [Amphritea balenae]GGK68735.1 NADP oxidoreductase [Amphritea balenae]
MINIAIVGSGPSGCYIADLLSKKVAGSQVDIYDRLPTPFGLVRAGVAPDHQGTKNIIRQFERTFSRDNVSFVGNVNIGSDISYQELKDSYDVVAITIGALTDRNLGIPGEDLQGVYGSGEFVAWYNGHPDQSELNPDLNSQGIAIIGNGNVALDIARLLAKTAAEMGSSDITSEAANAIDSAPITDIYMIGRRSPVEASFTNAELSEFADLERCAALVDPAHLVTSLPDTLDPKDVKAIEKNLETLRGYAENSGQDKPVRLHLMFCASPTAVIEADGKVAGLTLEKNTIIDGRAQASGEFFELPVQTIISAIGYRSEPIEGMPFDTTRGIVSNNEGLVEQGVYTSGWCKRGPQGVIPANRADSMAVGKQIIANLEANPPAGNKAGSAAIDELLTARNVQTVSFDQWQVINQAEISRAPEGKPREKFNRIDEMLAQLN